MNNCQTHGPSMTYSLSSGYFAKVKKSDSTLSIYFGTEQYDDKNFHLVMQYDTTNPVRREFYETTAEEIGFTISDVIDSVKEIGASCCGGSLCKCESGWGGQLKGCEKFLTDVKAASEELKMLEDALSPSSEAPNEVVRVRRGGAVSGCAHSFF